MTAVPLPELLAPAGSREALEAAVAAGANAVYLSGKRFGARKFAANFEEDELREAVAFCHARGVAVYVTVNTLIRDDELPDAVRTLVRLYALGVDAVLVQDVGLMNIGRRVVPDLPLHASTQMTIHCREGVAWARRQGLERVVLARELPLDEIEAIARSLGSDRPGLEIFIHGALCYCYSGQCLFSSIVGGRSGNRGMCAQPCRKVYALVRGTSDAYGRFSRPEAVPAPGPYLLSPRDLSVYPHLDRIVHAPVDALKIEGRMRSAGYVATVVAVYRRALDAIRAGHWRPSPGDRRDLLLAFNRSFTRGYLLGARGTELMGPERPDNRGVAIGRVIACDGGVATIRLTGDTGPEPGDGIAFRPVAGGEAVGTVVRTVRRFRDGSIGIRVPRPVGGGWEVAITRRAALSEGRKTAAKPQIPLDLVVSWEGGRPVMSGRTAGKGGELLRIGMTADLVMEPARSRPLTAAELDKQLRRTGGTPFAIRSLDLRYPGGLFSPLHEINRLRREFLALAEERLVASYRPADAAVAAARERAGEYGAAFRARSTDLVHSGGAEPVLAAIADSIDGVAGAVRGGCRRIYFEVPAGRAGGRCGGVPADAAAEAGAEAMLRMLDEASGICRGTGAALVWKWPRITRRAFLDLASAVLDQAAAIVDGVMVDHAGAAEAVRGEVPLMPIYGSVGLNVFNHETVRAYADTFVSLSLSQELSSDQLAGLAGRARADPAPPALEYIMQGAAELMVSEDCLLCTHLGPGACRRGDEAGDRWGIRDEAGRIFPLRCDGECRTHILNCVETCLIDRIPLLLVIGFDSLVIDARGRTGRYAEEIAALYAKGLTRALHPGSAPERDTSGLTRMVKERAAGGITYGHFLRGVSDE